MSFFSGISSFLGFSKQASRARSEEDEQKAGERRAQEYNRRRDEHSAAHGGLADDERFGGGFRDDDERQAALQSVFQRPPINGFSPADPRDVFMTPGMEQSLAGDIRRRTCSVPSSPTMDAGVPNVPQRPVGAPMEQRAVHAGAVSNGTNGFGFDPIRKYGINDRVLKHYQSRCFITWNSCALIAGHELITDACSIPAEDAMAHGYHLSCVSWTHNSGDQHEESEADFLKNVKRAATKMGIDRLAVRLCTKNAIFGTIVAIPVMKVTDEDGKDVLDESGSPAKFDYSQEYDPDKITRNSYCGFSVVEPQWLTYEFDSESSMDPTSMHFYEPTYIVKADGTKIHRSWVIRLTYKEVPDILKPTYYFGGLSLTQMMYERMWCADKIANEAPLLAMTKRLLIADGNMDQMIADPKKTNVFFRAINYFRDNFAVFVKKPSAQVQQLDTSLADLTPVTMAQYQLCAAIAQIPVTKLLKNVPSGLQATGQYEWDDYAQKLIGIQENQLRPFLERHYELYCRSNYWTEDGHQRTDISLAVEFEAIDLPKSGETTQQAAQQMQTAANAIGSGILTVSEARAFLRKTGNSFFDVISADVPEILKKQEEAKDPANQQGGMPGMPGMPADGGADGGGQENSANIGNENVFLKAIADVKSSMGAKTPDDGVFGQALSDVKAEGGEGAEEGGTGEDKGEEE